MRPPPKRLPNIGIITITIIITTTTTTTIIIITTITIVIQLKLHCIKVDQPIHTVGGNYSA